MGIRDEDVARVRASSDLVAIASEHIALKRVGRRWVGLCPFHAEKTPSFSINGEEGLYYCLAGETRVLTWEGVREIRDLAGGTHRILTEKGRWVEAPFRSFGVQRLMKVTLGRNGQQKVIFATPEHRWLLRGRGTHRYERTTEQLLQGQPLAWSFPANRTRRLGDLSPYGIAHGIAYGDGTRFDGMVAVDLHGDKDAQLLKWFPLNRTYQCQTPEGKPFIKVLDLPLFFKERPSLDEAPTYLAGWLAGYLAADGHVSKDGTCMLHSSARDDLEFVRAVCTRLGIGTYGITMQERVGIGSVEASQLYRIHLIAEDLDERFLLLDEHRRRFAAAEKAWIRRGWMVRSVEPTDRVEEVFCAEVEGSHNFTLEDNILTGNCFGCQAKGDAITFVREVEHLDFVGAVERLAAKAGVELHYDDEATSRDRQRRAHLIEAMERAVAWYHDRLLTAGDAGPARAYLRSRGYDRGVVEQYRIGWAPDEWDALARALKLPDDVLRDTGLGFLNRRNRQQDAFRRRVMFPILDVRGEPVAFGGRALAGTEGPKYKNSPETPIYAKSRTLYGLNWAKADVVSAGEVIVCEGYTDVIAFGQAGIPRAVATCGTALADEHFRTLKNFARRVVLAYDADAAGQSAAERFYEWERRYEIDIAVADLPAGSDPADVARRDPAALKHAVEHARPFLAFRLERALAAGDLRSPEGRARAAEAALGVIREHPSDFVRDQYLMQVADRCRIAPERLRQRLSQPADGPPPARERGEMRRAPEVHEGPELELLRLAVHRPEALAGRVHEVLFADELHLAAFRALASAATLPEAIDAADPAAATLLQRLAVEDTDAEADDVLALVAQHAANRAVAELEAEMRATGVPNFDIGWLKLTAERSRDPEAGAEAVAQLVAWLADRGEESGDE